MNRRGFKRAEPANPLKSGNICFFANSTSNFSCLACSTFRLDPVLLKLLRCPLPARMVVVTATVVFGPVVSTLPVIFLLCAFTQQTTIATKIPAVNINPITNPAIAPPELQRNKNLWLQYFHMHQPRQPIEYIKSISLLIYPFWIGLETITNWILYVISRGVIAVSHHINVHSICSDVSFDIFWLYSAWIFEDFG